MGRGDESLITKSRSHDQDGRQAQGHLNIKIKIMVFSEITGFGNYCSLRPETLQMQTTYEVNKGV